MWAGTGGKLVADKEAEGRRAAAEAAVGKRVAGKEAGDKTATLIRHLNPHFVVMYFSPKHVPARKQAPSSITKAL
jgi:hypothetical protein